MKITKSSGSVFADIGFDSVEANALAAKADLISQVLKAMREKKLTPRQTAALCGVDQPTLAKALSGRIERS